MLNFQKLSPEKLMETAPYFAAQNLHIGDFSLGFQFMWGNALALEYAYAAGCLVLREFYAGKHYFHYPLSVSGDPQAEEQALCEIEKFCRDTGMRLHYTNVPKERMPLLTARYADYAANNRRRWRDYLYEAEDFKTYAGKKFAGQRNHVNKFKKTYPVWQFRPYRAEDAPALSAFLAQYAKSQLAKGEYLAKEEMREAVDLVPHLGELGLFAGALTVDGKIVGFSAGERCGDMVIVHLEKALKEYEGAYPTLAQEFARAFCGDGVRFLNRMDDAGDPGLRKSKLQYHPCALVDKFNVLPRRPIDALSHFPEITTERLTLKAVEDADIDTYAVLASDVVRNRFWGYDWREDCPEETPAPSYFLELAREDFRNKEEVPLGIYAAEGLVGEAVLHRFGYRGEVEIGVRLLPSAEGKGYAQEAVRALAQYAFFKLEIERAEAKCFHGNEKSAKMLRAAGFVPCGEDATYHYFYMTAGS